MLEKMGGRAQDGSQPPMQPGMSCSCFNIICSVHCRVCNHAGNNARVSLPRTVWQPGRCSSIG